jgi:hypothetical protein
MAWESGLTQSREGIAPLRRNELLVRVISVQTGRPMAGARLSLSPGEHWALTDSTGVAEVQSLRQGRYQLRVGAPGVMPVIDSITVGFDGLRVLVAVTFLQAGDFGCPAPVRKPSNER